MRLIDADVLLQNYGLYKCVKHPDNAQDYYHATDTLMLYEIKDMIDDCPTVDVSETEDYRIPKKIVYRDLNYWPHAPRCPRCDGNMGVTRFKGLAYCPYCGQALEWEEE